MKTSLKCLLPLLLMTGCRQEPGQTVNAPNLLKQANELIYGNPEKAISLAEKVYGDPAVSVRHKVNALLCISTAYASKRDYNAAQSYILKTEELLPGIQQVPLRINVLNRIGSQYHDLGINDKATEYLDESLRYIERYPARDSLWALLGYNYTVRGFIYREQVNCNLALTYFRKAISAYERSLEQQVKQSNLSICYYNMGNCMLSLDRPADAKRLFQSSADMANMARANSLVAFALKGLAQAETSEGNFKKSVVLLQQALQASDGVGDLVLNRGIYEGLANNYLALGDYASHAVFQKKYVGMQQKIRSSERTTVNRTLATMQQQKSAAIREYGYAYGTLIAIEVLILTFIVFSMLRNRRRSEAKLKALLDAIKG